MVPAFSRPGELPTSFEEQLLASVQIEQPGSAKELWLLLAKLIGLQPLMTVLDEFGDGHVWVPSRSGLMQGLWLQVRDAEICRLVEEGGTSHRTIARRFNVSRTRVKRVASSRHGRCQPPHGKPR